MPVAVTGLRELNAAFAKSDKETRLGVRGVQREVAEPVRLGAETLAVIRIPNVGFRWWRMRVGVTRALIYVAPKERGIRQRANSRRRPRFADLLMNRAMEPALEARRPQLEADTERMLDRIANDFNKGGAL